MKNANVLYARYLKLVNKGRFRQALVLARRLTAIVKRLKGDKSVEYAFGLNEQAVTWSRLGFYAKALPLVMHALRIKRAVLGPHHGQVSYLQNNVAAMYRAVGDYEQAEKWYRLGLSGNVRRLGPRHPEVAHNLRYLADMFVRKGSYSKARRLFRRALTIYQKAYGKNHLMVGVTLNNLADVDKLDGHYERAEVGWKRCLGIMVKVKGAGHEETGTILNNIAGLLQLKGDYPRAEKRYREALAIYRKRLGDKHPFVALALNNLATNFYRQKRYAEAERLYKQVLRVREQVFSSNHPWVGLSLNNLAALYIKQRRLKRAAPLLRRAYAIAVKRYGKKSMQISTELNNLASMYFRMGEYPRSIKLYRRALRLLEPRLGKNHPELAIAQRNLANALVAVGKGAEAWTRRRRAFRIDLARAERLLPLMSEMSRERYLKRFLNVYEILVTQAVQLAAKDPKVARQALGLVLGYKGLLLGSLRRQRELVYASKDVKLRGLLEARNGAVRYLHGLIAQGQGRTVTAVHRRRLKRAREGVESTEAKLARATAGRLAVPPRPTARQLAGGLRPGEALVELVKYRPYKFRATWKQPHWGAERYAGFVLRANGRVSLVDLGSAPKLDRRVTDYLQAVRRSITVAHRRGVGFTLRWLDRYSKPIYQQIFAPLVPKLTGVKRLWIGPAGSLSLVPLGSLAQPGGRYLAERFELHLLSSGRDLLRRARTRSRHTPAKGLGGPGGLGGLGAVALVAPAYGRRRGSKPAEFRALRWTRGYTRRLRRRLGAILKRQPRRRRGVVTVLSGREATEKRLREIKRPLVLHLYTHGFYRPDRGSTGVRGSTSVPALSGSGPRPPSLKTSDPMQRSGVALAGANAGRAPRTSSPQPANRDNRDDGILTAVEAGTLELAGTELVLLGACQTGMGDPSTAQGVYGLRRALLYAGARSLLVSLWKVPEKQTRQLLFIFLRELGRGRSRSEALRRAQARIRAKNPLPVYWAGFVLVGDPGPL
jgi:CHAT domain-containing protein/tetratricopeptide (TPR) repeat protein